MRRFALFVCLAPRLYSLPINPEIVSGIVQQNGTEFICSDRSVLKWQEFSIAIDESLRLTLPNQDAAVLNQVTNIAQIDGSLFSNGQVYFSAPNGVIIGKDAVIDVGALLITTLDIDTDAFMTGEGLALFRSEGDALVRQGNISHSGVILSRGDGGKVYLNAPGKQIDIAGSIIGESVALEGAVIGLSPMAKMDVSGNVLVLAEKEAYLGGVISGQNIKIQLQETMPIHLLGDLRAEEKISIDAPNVIQHGNLLAKEVSVNTTISYMSVAKASVAAPEKISFLGNEKSSFFTSGAIDASGDDGGEIRIEAGAIRMAGGKIRADGEASGGAILIGSREFTDAILINGFTKISARGRHGGTVRVISKKDMEQYGSISVDGALKGGEIEVSGINVTLDRQNHLSAGGEMPGRIFFDPQNITVAASPTGVYPQYELIDPTPSLGTGFGASIENLSTGNVIVRKSGYNPGGASNVGAVYLYNGLTAELISTLTGSSAGDSVGGAGIEALTGNGNFVIRSTTWNSGAVGDAGAVTWASGTLGVSGTVSISNSLIGTTVSDAVGDEFIALTNGNYVVGMEDWNVLGAAADVGAVTWGSGTTGVTGTVSDQNSLTGSFTGDSVNAFGLFALTNGGYVVNSGIYRNGGLPNAGAVTWGSGTAGVTGTITAFNSLIGSSVNDNVGISGGGNGVVVLTNGNYVISTQSWDSPFTSDVGAVTWGNGATGVTGTISISNSLIGTRASTTIGNNRVTALTNGNYVVRATVWEPDSATPSDSGAVILCDGTVGRVGTINNVNSLIGTTNSDQVGNTGVTALTNGNYVVRSTLWNVLGGNADVGAVTWGSGTLGVTGTVSPANSLIGSTTNDQVGVTGVTALPNRASLI